MDDDERWAAVQARDAACDGTFVYGVRTTGVFCRPSCPSRAALRRNVEFFPGPAEAGAAGLRPCRRCRPDRPAGADRAELVARACRAIDDAPTAPTLAQLADRLGVGASHLHRLFRAETGLTPKAWADARRAERVRAGLDAGAPVTAAVHDAGYGSASRFHEEAPARLGMTATQRRAGGAGLSVRMAVAQSSLGAVLVAATDVGVCAIDLGDDPDALLRSFGERFPAAQVVVGDTGFDELVARVVALVEDPADGSGDAAALPLDLRGTAFQERVWRALREVPAGRTVGYAELAARLGAPGSARAVGAACGANRVAVAVPCHRVVRTDGGLAGYRWGVERKAELLRREGALDGAEPGLRRGS